MAITQYNLTVVAPDLLGDAYDPTTAAVVFFLETNLGTNEALIDTINGKIRLGPARKKADSTGTAVFTNLIGSDSDPADLLLDPDSVLQYRVRAEYVNAITRKRGDQWYSGWFELNADANLTEVATVDYAPVSWQTAFTQQAQEYLDAQIEISGIDDTDSAVAGLVSNELVGPLTNEALGAKFVTPWYADLNPGEAVAPLVYMDPLNFGAIGEYGSGAHDDTAAFQATVDRLHDEGGGVLIVRPGPKFRVEQLELKEGVMLDGMMPGLAGVSRPVSGGQIIQAEGSTVPLIIGTGFTDPSGGDYLLPCGLRNITLYGNPAQSPSGTHAFSAEDSSGNALLWQHGCTIENVIITGFHGDGIRIRGGSGVQDISWVFGHQLGGYPVHLGAGASDHQLQFVHLIGIKGDGCKGDAVVCIENQAASYTTLIEGLKSEQIINFIVDPVTTPSGSVVANKNALHLIDCDSKVKIVGLQHIASEWGSIVGGTLNASTWEITGGNKTKPGDAIKITNSNTGKRPTVIVDAPSIRDDVATQTSGSTPNLINDLSNASTATVANDSAAVVYGGHGSRVLTTREQTPATYRRLMGATGTHTMPSGSSGLNAESAIRGTLPGYVTCATGASTDLKVSGLRNAGDGRLQMRFWKDDGTAIADGFTVKTNGSSVTGWGLRGFLTTSWPTYTQTYTTAARTVNAYTTDAENVAYTGSPADAASTAKLADLNALRVAYENLRASHDNLLQVVTAMIDDLQAPGVFN